MLNERGHWRTSLCRWNCDVTGLDASSGVFWRFRASTRQILAMADETAIRSIMADVTEPFLWNPRAFKYGCCFKCFVCEQYMRFPSSVVTHIKSGQHQMMRRRWSGKRIRHVKEMYDQEFHWPGTLRPQPGPNPTDDEAHAGAGYASGSNDTVTPSPGSTQMPRRARSRPIFGSIPTSLYEHAVKAVNICVSVQAVLQFHFDVKTLNDWVLKLAYIRSAEKREKQAANPGMARLVDHFSMAATSAIRRIVYVEPPSSELDDKIVRIKEAIQVMHDFLDAVAAVEDVKPKIPLYVIDLTLDEVDGNDA